MYKTKTWQIEGTLDKKKLSIEDIAEVLFKNRGIKEKKEQEIFLNPKNPFEINLSEFQIDEKQIELAIERISFAIKNNEEIIVYGDYDADGVSATAIMWETIFNLGGKNALPYIPERFSEGYGLNIESIKNLKRIDQI